ncbi:MAG: GNAT family N-acetyltransferase [Edaphobacter sp.]
MTAFQIRAGLAGDLVAIVALERRVAEAPHWAEIEYAATVGKDESAYVRRCLFIAEADGALIGFAVGKIVGDLAELESVAVDLGARRCGVGRALCGAVIDWCKRQRATAVELEVRAASEVAIGLYRGLGFVPIGRRPEYYSAPLDDAVLMRLDLC